MPPSPRMPPLHQTCPPLPMHTPFTTHAPLHQCTPPFTMHDPLCHACHPPFATHAPGKPCMPPGKHACPPTMHAPNTHTPWNPACPRQPCMPPGNHACPPCGQTDACKLITLPQTSFANGNKYKRC